MIVNINNVAILMCVIVLIVKHVQKYILLQGSSKTLIVSFLWRMRRLFTKPHLLKKAHFSTLQS